MNDIDLEENVELVRLKVAERLGWRGLEYGQDGFMVGRGPGRKDLKVVPSYALDIKAAWEIIEYLIQRQIPVSIKNHALRGYVRTYHVEIGEAGDLLGAGRHQAAPMAICLALLDAPKDRIGAPPLKELSDRRQRTSASRQ